MKFRDTQETIATLANAAELVRCVAQNVMGNDVADTFEGSPLSRGIIYNLAQSTFQTSLSKKIGAM